MTEHLLNDQNVGISLLWVAQIGGKRVPKPVSTQVDPGFLLKALKKVTDRFRLQRIGLEWIRFVGLAHKHKVKNRIRVFQRSP